MIIAGALFFIIGSVIFLISIPLMLLLIGFLTIGPGFLLCIYGLSIMKNSKYNNIKCSNCGCSFNPGLDDRIMCKQCKVIIKFKNGR